MYTQHHIRSVVFRHVLIMVVILLIGGCNGGDDNGGTSPTNFDPVGTWGLTLTPDNAKAYEIFDRIMELKDDGTAKFYLPNGEDVFYGTWKMDDNGDIRIEANHAQYGYTITFIGDFVDVNKLGGTYTTSDGRKGDWTALNIGSA